MKKTSFFLVATCGGFTPPLAALTKELWVVPEASHTGGLGVRPAEFKRRVLQFYKRYDSIKARVQ